MAVYTALGTGPISFLDANQSQIDLPLSAVFFTPNGVDASSSAYASGANGILVYGLLRQLSSQGLIKASASPVTSAGMSIVAAQAGTGGNGVTVTFTQPSIAVGTVGVAVQAIEVFPGLTPATLGTALGLSAGTATGLVYLQSQTADAMPRATVKTALGAGPSYELQVLEADGTTVAFTLAATDTGADAAKITVAISLDPAPATTFTLTAEWSKPSVVSTLAALESANPFAYLVSFNGTAGALPGAGTVSLQGGAAGVAASAGIYDAS